MSNDPPVTANAGLRHALNETGVKTPTSFLFPFKIYFGKLHGFYN